MGMMIHHSLLSILVERVTVAATLVYGATGAGRGVDSDCEPTMEKKILVTAGPTHEPIDAVRYLANRSSGAMGIAIAEAARDAGWDVTLLLGPVTREAPRGMRAERFESTAELMGLLEAHFPACDVLVMAAAVADYRPKPGGGGKIERSAAGLTLELEPTPDLVAGCAARKRDDQMIVGFALEEPAKLAERARSKLARKGLEAIVANPLSTMGAEGIDATVITAAGRVESPGPMAKPAFARWLVSWMGSASGQR